MLVRERGRAPAHEQVVARDRPRGRLALDGRGGGRARGRGVRRAVVGLVGRAHARDRDGPARDLERHGLAHGAPPVVGLGDLGPHVVGSRLRRHAGRPRACGRVRVREGRRRAPEVGRDRGRHARLAVGPARDGRRGRVVGLQDVPGVLVGGQRVVARLRAGKRRRLHRVARRGHVGGAHGTLVSADRERVRAPRARDRRARVGDGRAGVGGVGRRPGQADRARLHRERARREGDLVVGGRDARADDAVRPDGASRRVRRAAPVVAHVVGVGQAGRVQHGGRLAAHEPLVAHAVVGRGVAVGDLLAVGPHGKGRTLDLERDGLGLCERIVADARHDHARPGVVRGHILVVRPAQDVVDVLGQRRVAVGHDGPRLLVRASVGEGAHVGHRELVGVPRRVERGVTVHGHGRARREGRTPAARLRVPSREVIRRRTREARPRHVRKRDVVVGAMRPHDVRLRGRLRARGVVAHERELGCVGVGVPGRGSGQLGAVGRVEVGVLRDREGLAHHGRDVAAGTPGSAAPSQERLGLRAVLRRRRHAHRRTVAVALRVMPGNRGAVGLVVGDAVDVALDPLRIQAHVLVANDLRGELPWLGQVLVTAPAREGVAPPRGVRRAVNIVPRRKAGPRERCLIGGEGRPLLRGHRPAVCVEGDGEGRLLPARVERQVIGRHGSARELEALPLVQLVGRLLARVPTLERPLLAVGPRLGRTVVRVVLVEGVRVANAPDRIEALVAEVHEGDVTFDEAIVDVIVNAVAGAGERPARLRVRRRSVVLGKGLAVVRIIRARTRPRDERVANRKEQAPSRTTRRRKFHSLGDAILPH